MELPKNLRMHKFEIRKLPSINVHYTADIMSIVEKQIFACFWLKHSTEYCKSLKR